MKMYSLGVTIRQIHDLPIFLVGPGRLVILFWESYTIQRDC